MKKLLILFFFLHAFSHHTSIAMENESGFDLDEGYGGGSDGEDTSTVVQAASAHASISITTWKQLADFKTKLLLGQAPTGVTLDRASLMQGMKEIISSLEDPIALVEKVDAEVRDFFDDYQPEGPGEFQPVDHVYLASSFQAACQRFIAEKPIEEVIDPLTHLPEKFIASQIFASEFFLALAQRKAEICGDYFVN